jgi:hypothetical protein
VAHLNNGMPITRAHFTGTAFTRGQALAGAAKSAGTLTLGSARAREQSGGILAIRQIGRVLDHVRKMEPSLPLDNLPVPPQRKRRL